MFLTGLKLLKGFDDKGAVQELIVSTAVVQKGHEDHREVQILTRHGQLTGLAGEDLKKHIEDTDLIVMDDGVGEGDGPEEWPVGEKSWVQRIYDHKQCDAPKDFMIRIVIIELDYDPIWEKLTDALDKVKSLIDVAGDLPQELPGAITVAKTIIGFIGGDEAEVPDGYVNDDFNAGWLDPGKKNFTLTGTDGVFQIKGYLKVTLLKEPCKGKVDPSDSNITYPWTDLVRVSMHQVGTTLEVCIKAGDQINPPDNLTHYSLTYRAFIDADANPLTGAPISNIGADYMAEVSYNLPETGEETYSGELLRHVDEPVFQEEDEVNDIDRLTTSI
jgi:hypothetical protein